MGRTRDGVSEIVMRKLLKERTSIYLKIGANTTTQAEVLLIEDILEIVDGYQTFGSAASVCCAL